MMMSGQTMADPTRSDLSNPSNLSGSRSLSNLSNLSNLGDLNSKDNILVIRQQQIQYPQLHPHESQA